MFARMLTLVLTLLVLPGCGDLFVPDFNNPSIEDLTGNPTRSQIANAAVGVLIAARVNHADFVLNAGILGREAYRLDIADPRFVTELLGPQLDPGSRAFGGDHWLEPYIAIRNANLLLNALEVTAVVTEAEKEALRGFAKTIQATQYLEIINAHDTNGAVIDVNRPIGDVGPIESKEAVFTHIATLLDEARTHLQAGGSAFPFDLTSGFAGFDTPQTFVTFNRALKARVDVYRGDFASALLALNESFLVDCASFDLGVYHTYSIDAGDLANPLFQDPATAIQRVHPSFEATAEDQPNGDPDRRFVAKTFRTEPLEQLNHASDLTFTVYTSSTSPVPIIRNEELILLRAEANIGLGNLAAAATDINCIRQSVGGLAAVTLTPANALDELLKQKFFSLILEGGHRWLDFRRYNKLGELPIDVPGDFVHARYPIPRDETQAQQ